MYIDPPKLADYFNFLPQVCEDILFESNPKVVPKDGQQRFSFPATPESLPDIPESPPCSPDPDDMLVELVMLLEPERTVPPEMEVTQLVQELQISPNVEEMRTFQDVDEIRNVLVPDESGFKAYHEKLLRQLDDNCTPDHHTYTPMFLDCEKCTENSGCSYYPTFRRRRQMNMNSKKWRKNKKRKSEAMKIQVEKLHQDVERLQKAHKELKILHEQLTIKLKK